MGWREFLFGAPAASAETKAAAVQLPAPAFWLPGNPTSTDLAFDDAALTNARAFAVSALVFRCMTFRARKLAEAPLWLADEDDGNEAWLSGTAAHPLAPLLEQPNPDQAAAAFLAHLSIAMDIGPALVVKNRDRGGRVASLYIFTSDQFTVEADTVDGVRRLHGKFTISDANGRPVPKTPADVLYFPTLGGVSPVDVALAHVALSERMRAAIKSSLAKSMRPASVTTVNGELQPDMFERFKAALSALYAGTDNVGKNVVLAGQDVKFQQLVQGLKDLELGPVQGDVEAAICQSFGVHPALVGAKIALENSSGLSDSLKPALSLFYDLEAFPRWQEIETAFTAGLLREIAGEPPNRFVRFVKDDIRALAPDLAADVNVAKAAADIATLNERRAMIKLPPLPGTAGDAIVAQPGPSEPAPGTAAEATKARPSRIESKALRTDAERAAYWQAFQTKAAKGMPAYEAAARRRFAEERAGVLATLRAAVPKSARAEWERKDDPGMTEDEIRERLRAAWEAPYLEAAALQIAADFAVDGPYAQAWAEEFQDLLRATMEGAAQEFISGVGVTFSMDNPALIAAIEERAGQLVANVTETTRNAIRDAIATGKAEGLTIEQIAKRIDDEAFGAMARARAQMIADTEVVGAINHAEWLAAQESGAFRSKRWIHSRGAEGRKYHIAHEHEGSNGGWVPLTYQYVAQNGQPFDRPHAPGLPASEVVRCDCVLAYSDVDPAQAYEESKAADDQERQRKVMDAVLAKLAEPAPPPVVNVTLPSASKGGTKRITYDVDAQGRHVAILEESV